MDRIPPAGPRERARGHEKKGLRIGVLEEKEELFRGERDGKVLPQEGSLN